LEHSVVGKRGDYQFYCHRCCDGDFEAWSLSKVAAGEAFDASSKCAQNIKLAAEFEVEELWLEAWKNEGGEGDPDQEFCKRHDQAFEKEVLVTFQQQPPKVILAHDRGVRSFCRAQNTTTYCEACWNVDSGGIDPEPQSGAKVPLATGGWEQMVPGKDIAWGDACAAEVVHSGNKLTVPMPTLEMAVRSCPSGVSGTECCKKVWSQTSDPIKKEFLDSHTWELVYSHAYDDLDDQGGDGEWLQDMVEWLERCEDPDKLAEKCPNCDPERHHAMQTCHGPNDRMQRAMYDWIDMHVKANKYRLGL